MSRSDATFSDAVAQFYDRYLGGLFLHHAEFLAERLAGHASGALLEVAAGTGAVTTRLAARLPPAVAITATDLNQAMLDLLATKPGMARVTIQQADALALPFADESFDAVVCQFGVMFYPDRSRGHAEAHRVLKPGGRYLFNVWDDIDSNPVAATVDQAMAEHFRSDPPAFLRRTPWGYHDRDTLHVDLMAGGFGDCIMEIVDADWELDNLTDAAIAFCHGTPLRGEIEARDPNGLDRATSAVAHALSKRFGPGPAVLPTQAVLIDVRK